MDKLQVPTTQSASSHSNSTETLSALGYKIFLDRYALKDAKKEGLLAGERVLVCVDQNTGDREIGVVVGFEGDQIKVTLADGTSLWRTLDKIDRPLEFLPSEMHKRVASAISSIEEDPGLWSERFLWLLEDWKFIPGGRILSAAGSSEELTFYNCFVLPSPKDSRKGIIETLSELVEIMSRGGGVGLNLSSLRPRHAHVKGVNGRSSGSVSWGGMYSFATGLIEQGGSRRGALMLMLDDWHPDLLEFVESKRSMEKLTNANISVAVSDSFMEALKQDQMWELTFPDTADPDYEELWRGDLQAWRDAGKKTYLYKRLPARMIWEKITNSAWACAEPGLWFKDRSNKMSNSSYFSPLIACNPCGEEPLPAYGVCNLGSLNLPRFLIGEDEHPTMDWASLRQSIRLAVRFLDNVIDITPYFFEKNRALQTCERRIGLGTMGLGELLIRKKLRYGSPESLQYIDEVYRFIAMEAYLASAELAQERGSFDFFEPETFLGLPFVQQFPESVTSKIREFGLRNTTLLTQAPTGSTGTMIGTSTGIEPFFYWEYERQSRLGKHTERAEVVREWREKHPKQPLPEYFVTAMDLTPEEHILVVAGVQKWVDAAISKTSNLPADYTPEQTRQLYEKMYELGCKGGTVYRDGCRDIQVLTRVESEQTDKDPRAGTPNTLVASKGIGDVSEQTGSFHSTPPPRSVAIRRRPAKRHGATTSIATPSGTAHITMNDDEQGDPLEVFLEIGKGGSDIKAMAEALGRLTSLVLRISSPLTPHQRVEEIVNQLKGIGGGLSLGFGPNRILSLPDALAQALEEHYLSGLSVSGDNFSGSHQDLNGDSFSSTHPQLGATERGGFVDLCPSCGQSAFVRTGGCSHCLQCGYSRC